MFSKKKKAINVYDRHFENQWKEMLEHSESLCYHVGDAYIKNLCISLYPYGADKDKAIEDSEKSKKSMLRAVATYDSARTDLINIFKRDKDKMENCANWNPESQFAESHRVIEVALKNFIGRR